MYKLAGSTAKSNCQTQWPKDEAWLSTLAYNVFRECGFKMWTIAFFKVTVKRPLEFRVIDNPIKS